MSGEIVNARMSVFLAVGALCTVVGLAEAKSITASVARNDVRAYSGTRGTFYTIDLPIPGDVVGKRLDSVWLDFVVDVTALAPEDSFVTPVVGAFPLKGERSVGRSGELVSGVDFESIAPSARPIALGIDREIRLDITEIVAHWLKEPAANHGLVIGALTGPSVGIITLKDGALGVGKALSVTFFYQDRAFIE